MNTITNNPWVGKWLILLFSSQSRFLTVNQYWTKIFGCSFKVSNWHPMFSSMKTSLGFLNGLMDPCRLPIPCLMVLPIKQKLEMNFQLCDEGGAYYKRTQQSGFIPLWELLFQIKWSWGGGDSQTPPPIVYASQTVTSNIGKSSNKTAYAWIPTMFTYLFFGCSTQPNVLIY